MPYLLLGFVCLCLGSVFGYNIASPETQYEVIHKTDTVTEIKTVTVTDTVVPEACLRAAVSAQRIDSAFGAAYAGLPRVEQIISDATVAMGRHNPQGLVRARNAAHELNNDTRITRQALMHERYKLDGYLRDCEEQLP